MDAIILGPSQDDVSGIPQKFDAANLNEEFFNETWIGQTNCELAMRVKYVGEKIWTIYDIDETPIWEISTRSSLLGTSAQ